MKFEEKVAVRGGDNPGIYSTWEIAKQQATSGSVKKFRDKSEALSFIR